MHWHDSLEHLFTNTLLEGNVAALLSQLSESGAFQRATDALAGYARQFGHINARLRRSSRRSVVQSTALLERPKSRDRVRWLRRGCSEHSQHPCPDTTRSIPGHGRSTCCLLSL